MIRAEWLRRDDNLMEVTLHQLSDNISAVQWLRKSRTGTESLEPFTNSYLLQLLQVRSIDLKRRNLLQRSNPYRNENKKWLVKENRLVHESLH